MMQSETDEGRSAFALRIDVPEGECGFVEFRRSFCVRGNISSSGGKSLPDGARLTVRLTPFGDEKIILRSVTAEQKRTHGDPHAAGLLRVPEEKDPFFAAFQAFGFPEAIPPLSEAENKCWFDDKSFKAVIVSATDAAHGAVWDDGMHLKDPDGKPYDVLPEGEYLLTAMLSGKGGETLAESKKKVTVGVRKSQAIFRFHPDAHREAMFRWCEENGYAYIREPLPGYLDPYAGEWERHMGFLTMYRANDIALFASPATRVKMFLYLIDPTSTSYETELAYLQSVGALSEKGRFEAFFYDIGEAELSCPGCGSKGKIVSAGAQGNVSLCRIDTLKDGKPASDGVFFTDGSGITSFSPAPEDGVLCFPAGRPFALAGVICPWQMDPEDFRKKEDNTYEILNAPDDVVYEFMFDNAPWEDAGLVRTDVRKTGLERLSPELAGSSVFEFYHVFSFPAPFAGTKGRLSVLAFDRKHLPSPAGKRVYEFRIE